ncbi:MAG: alpha/beta hydrolase [Bdellovibrionales bacterium]
MNLILFIFISFGITQAAFSQSLSSFKNSAFSHERVLESRHNRAFQVIDYDEMRDVNGRDEIPVKRALPSRVELLPENYYIKTRIAGVSTHQAGAINSASFAVIFIHGAGGNKDLGFDDWTFSGNFNRLKNLTVRNKGVYLSPTARLNSSGANAIGRMIKRLHHQNSQMKIVLSCGSAGGLVCWTLAKSSEYSKLLSGLVFLGTAVNMPEENIPYIDDQKPIIFAHGSKDSVLPWQHLKQSFDEIRASYQNYPIKYFLYNGGIHGTPIRTIDWREGLNWIFKH